MKFNIGLYQLYIFNIPSWVSFGHFYMSFHKCLSGMPYILRKNISKFVYENSWFQIADAFQSLLCDGRFAAVVNNRVGAGQRLWYRLYFFEINRKRATGNSVMFILLHRYCLGGFGCGKMVKFTSKIFNIFCDVVHTRRDHLTLSTRCKCTDRCES